MPLDSSLRVAAAADRDSPLRVPNRRSLGFIAVGAASGVPVANYTVTGLSVICALLVPALIMSASIGRAWIPAVMSILGFLAYATSATVNGLPDGGPNSVVFLSLALYIVGISLLCRRVEDVCALLVGIGIGTGIFYAFVGTPLTIGGGLADNWKYGFAPAVTVSIVYVLVIRQKSIYVISAALVLLALTSLALNFRSHALVCVVAVLILVISKRQLTQYRPLRMVTAVVAMVAAFALILPYASRSGLFGRALETKVSSQLGEGVPMILSGRTEPPLSFSAIVEKPWFGWGSAHNIPEYVFAHARLLAVDIGFPRDFRFEFVWKLPDGSASFHSIVLGTWAEAGIFGALLPLWLLASCLVIIIRPGRAGRWMPVTTLVAVQACWDLVFSPWSYNLATVFAAVAVLCVLLRPKRPVTAGSSQ
ncbi:O-antigen ligase family protein [Rhodococcus sp. IEGM 1381]|uniref:O-antigen ligase family protein n=1 Tax=Rhodococcus sp. IEGM 1381 TaxID=3047085 RepID=UPI0024B7249E|nr:O-antigen ligase family protein [Rhodococcus sp. IEGM 1381]MDI9894234.1 O-antigen ligase family protein [Rhodococcus sp. IEGM 1381]